MSWYVQLIVDYATRGPVVRFFTNLGSNGGWKNPTVNVWSRNFDWLILIHEQLGISNEGVVDAANVTFDKTKTSLKKIASPHAFVENGM
jgi:hypothetical protein